MSSEASSITFEPSRLEELEQRLSAEMHRRQASTSLMDFTMFTLPRYRPAAHHFMIAEHLELLESRALDRLLTMAPPRHGKSELVSRRFPAWYIGRHPEEEIIHASYGAALAKDFGRTVRNIVGSSQFADIFPGVELAADSKANDKWNTNFEGAYYATSTDGAATGRGAHLLNIDDPVKGRKEAQSETIRNSVRDWYRSTAYTRLAPGGIINLTLTRWHEMDLAGEVLEHMRTGGEFADNWTQLDLQAIDENGAALWPERFPLEVLQRIQSNIGPYEWNALYMQRPSAMDGDYFKRDWFGTYERLPKTVKFYGASDYAVSDGEGDYTVHLIVAVDHDGYIYVVDIWRDRKTSDVWVESFIDMIAKHKPSGWAEESGQILKSMQPIILKRMRERKTYCVRTPFPSASDKTVRARSIQARAASGMVKLPKDKPWVAAFIGELLKFPNGQYDDQVDAFSLIGRMLDQMRGTGLPSPPKQKPDGWESGWGDDDNNGGASSWKTA